MALSMLTLAPSQHSIEEFELPWSTKRLIIVKIKIAMVKKYAMWIVAL